MKTIRNGIRHSPRNAARRTTHVALAIVTLAGWTASAATRYVWQDSPNPTPPFDSWAQAATNIQDAVDAAMDRDTVLVMGGVYATGGRAVVGTMTNRVAIAKAITVESLMGPELTVIEGAPAPGSSDTNGNGDGAIRCVYLGTNAVLSGFTLTKGHTKAELVYSYEMNGGGVWCEDAATLTNCIITGNSASYGGGGVFQGTLYNSGLVSNSVNVAGGGAFDSTLYNCTLTGNSASEAGGGAYSCTLYECVLTRNSSESYGGGSAGGTLNHCTLANNSAVGSGGGASGGTLTNCTLTGNSASYGGGCYWSTLHNSSLKTNSADEGGGAYYGTLYNCVLTGNRARLHGGGFSGDWNIIGGIGGGFLPIGFLHNCTLTDNTAGSSGGGADSGWFYNCIVYHNKAPEGANYGTLIGLGGTSGIQPTFYKSCTTPLPSNGTNNIDADPQLATLTHLSSSSPCIGAGDSAYASGVDIDGEPWADPPSMGADQLTPGQATGALSMEIHAGYTSVAPGFAVRFFARNQGAILTSVWDFDDGTIATNQAIVCHAWSAPGSYTVRLTGYNDTFPSGVSATAQVEVSESVYYVNQANSTPEFPYNSWESAATSIQDAIEAGTAIGRLILVTNGVYATGSVEAEGSNRIALVDPMVVQSINGPDTTAIFGGSGIRCAYVGNNATLSGFRLSEGEAEYGGGAWCERSGTLTNCFIDNNLATEGGGVLGGTLFDCNVSENLAGDYGGGSAKSTLHGCTLRNNLAWEGGGSYAATLYDCDLEGNSAGAGGGSIHSTLHNCTVTGNSAGYTGGGANGGTLYNCRLTGNSASRGGGAYDGTLHDCILAGNSANTGGGFSGSSWQIIDGDGRFGWLYNCTVTGNSAITGGGTYLGEFHNCIVYFNTAPDYPNHAFGNMGHSCTTPLAPGTGNITNAPLFVDLTAGDLHLRYGSPGIDAGTDLSATLTADFDGNPRPLDGDGDGFAAFDMGAYEFDARSIVPQDWFTSHGLDPADPHVISGNPDHDVFTTFQEWLADTDPTNALSFFRIEDISKDSPAMISFQSSSNRTYTLWSTPGLASPDWAPVSSAQAIAGTGGPMTLGDDPESPQQFYRVQVNMP